MPASKKQAFDLRDCATVGMIASEISLTSKQIYRLIERGPTNGLFAAGCVVKPDQSGNGAVFIHRARFAKWLADQPRFDTRAFARDIKSLLTSPVSAATEFSLAA